MIVIRKDEALKSVKNKAWYPPGCDNKDRHIDFLFNGCSEIDLVHCTDCRHRDEKCGMGEHRWCEILKMSTVPNDYCSYGERREE